MTTVAQSIKNEFDTYNRLGDQNVYHFDCYLETCLEKCVTHYNNNECTWNCIKDQFVNYDWHVFEFNDGSKLRMIQGYDVNIGTFETCEII